MKKILNNKLYLITLISDLISNFGDTVYYMALMNYALFLPQPAFALSIITFSETVPILTSFFAGYWADQTKDKVRQIEATLLFRCSLFILLAFFMGHNPALWIVLVAAVTNFLSDIAGQYENGLYIPIHLHIIADEDREDFIGFGQSLRLLSVIFFQSSGAFLISFLSYSQLAFFNAATFLAAFLILLPIRKPLKESLLSQNLTDSSEHKQEGSIFASLWQGVKRAVMEVAKIKEIRTSMVIVPIVNGLFVIFPILLTLIMSENKQFILINPATTLAIFEIAFFAGSVMGGVLVMNLLKKIKIEAAIQLAVLLLFLLAAGFYLQSMILILPALVPLGILSGCLNAKMMALIYNSVPQEKVGSINGGITTYFQSGVLLCRLLTSAFLLFLKAQQLAFLICLLSLGLLGYTIYRKFTEKRA